MIPTLRVSNLTKIYGKKKVVNEISFALFPGQIFGLLGPNGAGKSTIIRMITGLTPSSSGEISICGYGVNHAFKRAISNVGAVIEMPQLYSYLSGENNLKILAKLYGKAAIQRIPQIIKLVGMENRIKDKFSTYSLGMKQRLGIAQALLGKPKLLILDEPTNGLDPNGIVELRNILKALAEKENMTIIISSHNLSELEQTCDIIGIINNGKMIEYKTMEEITNLIQSKQKVQLLCNYPNYAGDLLRKKFKLKVNILGNSIILPLKEKYIATVISYLATKKIKVYGIKKIQKSLEELYFEMLNKERPSTSIV